MINFVVCVWNAEKYIKNCIRTLKSQQDRDFKVFIIDDVSTDNTVEITKSLIVDDNRFNLIINTEKKFKLKNLDELIPTFDDDDNNTINVARMRFFTLGILLGFFITSVDLFNITIVLLLFICGHPLIDLF